MNVFAIANHSVILIAASLLSSAAALEIKQSGGPLTADAPAIALPAFLDTSRLADFQDAWRARFAAAGAPVVGETAGGVTVSPPSADAVALAAAQRAVTRAEEASREAAVVRARAEELSRRFSTDQSATAETASSDPAMTQPATAQPATTETAPTETASIDGPARVETVSASVEASPSSRMPPAMHILGPTDVDTAQPAPAEEAPKTAAAPTDDAPVIEDMATRPAKRAKRETIAASRVPTPVVTRKQPAVVTTVSRTAPDGTPESPVEPSAMMPTEIRSFGWNAQP